MKDRWHHFAKNNLKLRLLLSVFLLAVPAKSQTPRMMIVVIDGARYTETFGDPDHTFVPEMAELAAGGAVVNEFRNDGITYTSRAIPALWCGTWTEVSDTVYGGVETSYAVKPTIFEYAGRRLFLCAEIHFGALAAQFRCRLRSPVLACILQYRRR